jgi:glyoxylase-like metal-dependent hydrolase (beta-lactamase superfamily II)
VPISRRDFLKSSGGAALLASGAVWAPQAAHAQLDLGDMRLDVLSDGSLRLPGSFIFGPMPQDELAPVLEAYGQSPDLLTPPCNVTLLRHGGRNILFDVGSGPDFAPTAGLLLDSLDALGLAPEDITEASYFIGKTEWDYWIDPNTVDRISSDRVPFAVGAKRRLEAIEDNIEFFKDGEEILPGVAARASFGHTPGHMAFEIRSGAQAAMVVGDAIGNDHVALARPNWISGSDQDGEAGAATRVSLLDQIATEQMPMIGFHITQGGIGRVEKATEGYHFIAET